MAVASELRSHYGIPVEKLQFVLDFMTKDDGRDHFVAAVQIMQRGLQVLLLTDLQKTFLMDSDLELEDMFQAGFLRAAGQGNYVLLNLNLIVNRLLGAGATPVKLKSSRTPYTDLAKIRQSYTACTKAEMKVLDLLRQPTSKKLTIHLDEGKMKRLEVERDIRHELVKDDKDATRVHHESEWETVTFSLHANRIAQATRVWQLTMDDKVNKKLLFTGRVVGASKRKSK